jgi:hypothetical protein
MVACLFLGNGMLGCKISVEPHEGLEAALQAVWLYRRLKYETLQGAMEAPQRLRIGTFW